MIPIYVLIVKKATDKKTGKAASIICLQKSLKYQR